MENHRDRISVIFAGYTDAMQRFVQSNDGLASRITKTIYFDDYNEDELIEILCSFGKDFVMETEFIDNSRIVFSHWLKTKGKSFGNARDVRKYFKECTTSLYKRLIDIYGTRPNVPETEIKKLTGLDIPKEYSSLLLSVKTNINRHNTFIPLDSNRLRGFVAPIESKASDALLLIDVDTINGERAFGSGFIITEDGYAITCNHVIVGEVKTKVRLSISGDSENRASWHTATVIKTDEDLDIALIKINDLKDLPTMKMQSPGARSVVSDEIYLISYPFGAYLSDDIDVLNYSRFDGKIASLQVKSGMELIYVDMQAKQGSSGGAVISKKTGEVVGILCGSQTHGDALVEEINYVLPIRYAWEMFTK